MALLDNATRVAAWAEFMRDESRERNTMSLTKADLREALDAVDDWVEANSQSYNTALPQPARGALTSRQKAKLLAIVLQRRFGASV